MVSLAKAKKMATVHLPNHLCVLQRTATVDVEIVFPDLMLRVVSATLTKISQAAVNVDNNILQFDFTGGVDDRNGQMVTLFIPESYYDEWSECLRSCISTLIKYKRDQICESLSGVGIVASFVDHQHVEIGCRRSANTLGSIPDLPMDPSFDQPIASLEASSDHATYNESTINTKGDLSGGAGSEEPNMWFQSGQSWRAADWALGPWTHKDLEWKLLEDGVATADITQCAVGPGRAMLQDIRQRARGLTIDRVLLIWNERLTQQFNMEMTYLDKRVAAQQSFPAAVLGSLRFDQPAQEKVLHRLKQQFLQSKLKYANVLLCWHGCTEEAADGIIQSGVADLRRTDGGFFGAGVYLTPDAAYAMQYSSGAMKKKNRNGAEQPQQQPQQREASNYVMLLCAVCTGQAYPVTRIDYTNPDKLFDISRFDARFPMFEGKTPLRGDKALHPQCDSHYICVSKERKYQAADSEDAHITDEIVVKSESQVLPLFKVYVKHNSVR